MIHYYGSFLGDFRNKFDYCKVQLWVSANLVSGDELEYFNCVFWPNLLGPDG